MIKLASYILDTKARHFDPWEAAEDLPPVPPPDLERSTKQVIC